MPRYPHLSPPMHSFSQGDAFNGHDGGGHDVDDGEAALVATPYPATYSPILQGFPDQE